MQNVTEELNGERVDVIQWYEDQENLLKPRFSCENFPHKNQ